MHAVRKMGSLSKLVGMLPGAGQMRAQLDNLDERELDRATAIIQSMTPAERRDTKLLNGSRRSRIAKGSGTTVTEVNSLVDRFEKARKMMKQVARGGLPGIPGMGSLPGAPRRSGGQKKRSAKSGRSGNPAKRAEQEAAAAVEPVTEDQAFELPSEFKGLLGR
jgi:signal recognition particle subunit SRP54